MSHFQCPVCGKHSSIRTYDPEGFVDEVDLVSFTGLGRGRGFSKEVVASIEDDPELKERLLNRVREVERFLSKE